MRSPACGRDLVNEAFDHDRDLIEDYPLLFLVQARKRAADLTVARLHPGTNDIQILNHSILILLVVLVTIKRFFGSYPI